jgi:hypothetical protein
MRPRLAFFPVPLAVIAACWFVVFAQQPNAEPANRVPVDPADVAIIAGQISQRADHLQPMFEQVHAADWVAKGAPQTYVSQWSSLVQQNQAIRDDMAATAQHPEAMQDIMKALFRVHRFDSDLAGLLAGVRRYQNPALADLMESVASGDQNGVEKLQQYVLDLADAKERQLDVEDKEAQRCRATLANQTPAPATPKKTNGNSK